MIRKKWCRWMRAQLGATQPDPKIQLACALISSPLLLLRRQRWLPTSAVQISAVRAI